MATHNQVSSHQSLNTLVARREVGVCNINKFSFALRVLLFDPAYSRRRRQKVVLNVALIAPVVDWGDKNSTMLTVELSKELSDVGTFESGQPQ